MDSSELMVIIMVRWSLASEVGTDQFDSSVISLEAKLTSVEVVRPFLLRMA